MHGCVLGGPVADRVRTPAIHIVRPRRLLSHDQLCGSTKRLDTRSCGQPDGVVHAGAGRPTGRPAEVADRVRAPAVHIVRARHRSTGITLNH